MIVLKVLAILFLFTMLCVSFKTTLNFNVKSKPQKVLVFIWVAVSLIFSMYCVYVY